MSIADSTGRPESKLFPTFGEGTGMALGKVKWFNNAKGYGFILPENGDEDLFAHYSSVEMEGYKTLTDNQKVSFKWAIVILRPWLR